MNKWTFREITRDYLLQLQRFIVYRYRMILKPDIVEIEGIRLIIPKGTPVRILKALYRELYENAEKNCILKKLAPDDVVLEIGAGWGFLSMLSARITGSTNVFSYEANPDLIPIIHANYKNNNLAPGLVHAAITEKHKKNISFWIDSEFWKSSLTLGTDHKTTINVPNCNINEEIHKIKPTFLIMDIEGYEASLIPAINLSGIRKLLIEFHPNLIGEEQTRILKAQLTKAGFTIDPIISDEHVTYLERL